MSKVIILVVVLAAVMFSNAFQLPKSTGKKAVKPLKMSIEFAEKLPGAIPPTDFFDPWRITENRSDKEVLLLREAEIKHGRVAMLAASGLLTGEWFDKSPLFDGKIMGAGIYHFQQVQTFFPQFWITILLSIGAIEFYNISIGWDSITKTMKDPNGRAFLRDYYIPGNLNFDPLNLCPEKEYDNENFIKLRTNELQNGRLAMLGISGMVVQETVDHLKILDHWNQFGFGLPK